MKTFNKTETVKNLFADDNLDDRIYEEVDKLEAIFYALESIFFSEDSIKSRAVEVQKVRPLLGMAVNSMSALTKTLDERLIK